MNVLVLEASTSSVKAMIYGGGRALAEKAAPISRQGDAAHILSQLVSLGAAVAEDIPVDCVSLVSIWHSLVLLEGEEAVSPLWTWQNGDFGREAATSLSKEQKRRFYLETGCMPHGMYPLYMLKRLGREGSLKGKKLLSAGGYLFSMLTGEYAETLSMASGSGLLSLAERDYSPMILKWADIEREALPRLLALPSPGRLNGTFASLLGIKEGTPVFPAQPDGGMNHFGIDDDRDMTLSVGTSGAVRMLAEGRGEPWGIWRYLSWDGKILAGAASSGACNCLDWAKNRFFGPKIPYEELSQYPVNRRNLPFFMPYLYGERCPGWDESRRAGFWGLEPAHGPIALYHSVMEGILLAIRQCYDAVVQYCGEPRRIFVSGGILKDMNWLAMLAGILGRDISIDVWAQASLMGGALLALRYFGETEVQQREEERLYPREEDAALYQQRYAKFLAYYEAGQHD